MVAQNDVSDVVDGVRRNIVIQSVERSLHDQVGLFYRCRGFGRCVQFFD